MEPHSLPHTNVMTSSPEVLIKPLSCCALNTHKILWFDTGLYSIIVPWPQSKGGCFYKKISMVQLIAYFGTPQKILKYYFRVTRWFVELNMVISKTWESYALMKLERSKWRKMKRNAFCNLKKHIFFTSLFWLLLRFCISKMIWRAW
jgi:hypothetical protein